MESFQGKTGSWAILPAPSELSPEYIATSSTCMLTDNCSFVCYSLLGFMGPNFIGFQSQVCFWAHPSGQSLKNWGTKCRVQTLCPSVRSWELVVLSQLYGTMLEVGFMPGMGLILYYMFPCGYFLIVPVYGVLQLVSGPLSEGIVVLWLAIHSVCS